ncbi:ABC transporter ATP-binding protein [Paenibacillus kobensis]|uniref:ABC transporter ATP-binding protein n=1 Tax=Paenibacillus kobensis TaxID=59841 RepID=UPI000FD9303B|nr:ATP-binding cassette domain-containing protein [Paenibacillus kobensis]
MPQVILKNIKKQFRGNTIFDNISICVDNGDLVAIKGTSGIGKSTLLNIISGLEKPSSGAYTFNGRIMSDLRLNQLSKIRSKQIGYISQFSPMIPKLTAIENIKVPLLFNSNNKDNKSLTKRIEELVVLFGIQNIITKRIELLSGGEIQRVGIIRSIATNPELIVADEPTNALDDETALKVLHYFKELKSNGTTIIIATHSANVADYCDEVYLLSKEGLCPVSERTAEV